MGPELSDRVPWRVAGRSRTAAWVALVVLIGGGCEEERVLEPDPVVDITRVEFLELRDDDGDPVSELALDPGESATLQAFAIYDDGTEGDVTGLGRWYSSDPSLVSVNGGSVVAVGDRAGRSQVYLTFQQFTTPTVVVTVIPESPSPAPSPVP